MRESVHIISIFAIILTISQRARYTQGGMNTNSIVISVIPTSVSVGDNVQFGQGIAIGEDVTIDNNFVIGDWAVIEPDVDIKKGSLDRIQLHPL